MKNKKFLAIPLIFFILVLSSGMTQDETIPSQIPAAIRSGNAAQLASHFNELVELVILDKEDVSSKAQAERILKDFFSTHPPVKFTIKHQGGKTQSKYAIGQLETGKGKYRVYFLLKWSEGKAFIHQLRIESENG